MISKLYSGPNELVESNSKVNWVVADGIAKVESNDAIEVSSATNNKQSHEQ